MNEHLEKLNSVNAKIQNKGISEPLLIEKLSILEQLVNSEENKTESKRYFEEAVRAAHLLSEKFDSEEYAECVFSWEWGSICEEEEDSFEEKAAAFLKEKQDKISKTPCTSLERCLANAFNEYGGYYEEKAGDLIDEKACECYIKARDLYENVFLNTDEIADRLGYADSCLKCAKYGTQERFDNLFKVLKLLQDVPENKELREFYYFTKGEAYRELAEVEEFDQALEWIYQAKDCYSKLYELTDKKEDASAYLMLTNYKLATLYEDMGRIEEAASEYEKVFERLKESDSKDLLQISLKEVLSLLEENKKFDKCIELSKKYGRAYDTGMLITQIINKNKIQPDRKKEYEREANIDEYWCGNRKNRI